MNANILLIEDEPGLVMTISDLLTSEGYAVTTAVEGESGFHLAMNGLFSALVLDVMLPRMNGFDVCRALRQKGNDVAILMLTAKTQVVDRVVGLKLGADDYLTKPFDPAELLARLEALLRRLRKDAGLAAQTFRFNDVEIDFRRAEVHKGGHPVTLTCKELQLLRYLIENRDRVVPREELMQSVWEYASDVSSRTIDTHVAWLRQKIEDKPQSPRHIQTIRGTGYRFSP